MATPDMLHYFNYEGQLLPAWNFMQLDPEEFYRRLNATLFSAAHNLSLNGTFDFNDFDAPLNCDAFGNIFTMILYAIVCIVGLLGNTLVIYVVLRFSKMQTVTNIYILNLAIADECFLIGLPFLIYTMQIGSWKFGKYMCKAYMVSTSVTQFTSSIFLLIMSADRYIAVCHPISSPRFRTPFISKVVSAIAWLTSVLLMLPVILFASTVGRDEHISCNIEWPESEDSQSGATFILYSLLLGFATPLTFILVFYCLVIRKLHTVGPKNKSKEKKRSHRKVTKMVLTVITVYIMCWLPYWISQVALINSSPSKCASRLEVTVFLLVGCLSYSNSAMNPILYAFLSDNFKKSFMKACTCAARKDVNAQLQLENSFFPKFGKGRQSDRLLGAAGRRNDAAMRMGKQSTTTASIHNHHQQQLQQQQQQLQQQRQLLAITCSAATNTTTGTTTTTLGSGVDHNGSHCNAVVINATSLAASPIHPMGPLNAAISASSLNSSDSGDSSGGGGAGGGGGGGGVGGAGEIREQNLNDEIIMIPPTSDTDTDQMSDNDDDSDQMSDSNSDSDNVNRNGNSIPTHKPIPKTVSTRATVTAGGLATTPTGKAMPTTHPSVLHTAL